MHQTPTLIPIPRWNSCSSSTSLTLRYHATSLTEPITMAKRNANVPFFALVLSTVLFAAFLYGGDLTSLKALSSVRAPANPIGSSGNGAVDEKSEKGTPKNVEDPSTAGDRVEMQYMETPATAAAAEEEVGSCDVFTGNWVFDDRSRPLYREEECDFLTAQMTCMANGRPDNRYQKWRWQPRDCNLSRFDAKLLLERLRGKRLMYVGDSLNRNQWESMVCLVQPAVPSGNKSMHHDGSLTVFRIAEYNATVEFYWAPFLAESNSDSPKLHSIIDRIIMPESISKHAVHWKGVDFLIFNTYVWWMNTGEMKVLRGSFDEGSTEYDEIARVEAYGRVLRTWARWVEDNVDPNTHVLFSSVSPLHSRGTDWNNPNGMRCAKETEPILNATAPPDVGVDWRMFAVALNATRSIRHVPVSFLNITKLSEYRKDAHTSVYTTRQGKQLTAEQKADPGKYADCIHWCLPGLPDTWNELLYAKIMSTKHA